VLPTFVIGLREGLEAALIVGIVAAFLGQQGRKDALRQVWIGTAAAVAICVAVAIALQIISSDLPQRQQEGLETVVGALAICMVTYMTLFMRKHARSMKEDLQGAAASALAQGSSRVLVMMAFLAVLREGFETAVFLLATFHASGDATTSWLGAVLGIVLAAAIGYGIYKGGVKLNMARFFRVTGLVLVVVAAGLVMTAFHTAYEAGWLTAGQAQAFDLSWLVRPGTPLSSLLTGVLGLQPFPVWIEVIAWLAYLVPMLLLVAWPSGPPKKPRRGAAVAVLAAILALVAAGCSSSGSGSAAKGSTTVKIQLTSQGCQPKPASIPAGAVEFDVTNSGAGSVTEAELRTNDKAHILGEQENLTPGLSGGFSLTVQPGTYTINCPGASQPDWTFKVTGKASGPAWESNPQLVTAVRGYNTFVKQNTTDLVSHTQTFCQAISAGNMNQAKVLYPQARVYYEKIEPVASVWGSLDTSIDGRWENPVTVKSQFTGFHRIEQMLWQDNSRSGAAAMCSGLVKNEQQLLTLVSSAQYNPLDMAAGATDLVNEAATTKITGEEERYSNTDLPVFEANVEASMEVVNLLQPYLQAKAASTVSLIKQRDAAVESLLTKYKATPGYDSTGWVDYSKVTQTERKQLSTAVNALAEAMSKVSGEVSA
jgi:high-affinity iron transporter